jgi:hypothetical protein
VHAARSIMSRSWGMGRMDFGVSPGDSGSMAAIAVLWSFHGRFSYLKAPSFCKDY